MSRAPNGRLSRPASTSRPANPHQRHRATCPDEVGGPLPPSSGVAGPRTPIARGAIRFAQGSCRLPHRRPRLNVQSRLGASDVTTEASTDTTLSTDAKLKAIIAEQEEIFVRRQPKS